ncbi:MAG TPA: MFS transporter [Solirubrobacteraceae bacterium]|nr:MFS transporter [Solirubrobacteraceae bacterium]
MSARAASPAAAPLTAVGAAPEREHTRHALLLTVCCLAQFMVILDVSIVNVALPSIHRSLGFSASDLQWVVNAYAITFAGFLMLSGRAADLLGGRRTFIAGVLVFALASLAGGTAADRGVLIGARALQGLGGAIMAAASLAIITSSFRAGPERHRAIGLWGAMNGAGGATGTLLGGIITQELSWRWVLLINLPIGIAGALVARVVIADRRRTGEAGNFDLAGAIAVTLGLLTLVYGIVNAGTHGWGASVTLVPIAVGIALLVGFVVIEGRFATAPLVPLRVFSNRLLRVSNIVVILLSAALFPMWYFCSLYLQEVLHFGPLDAGLAFLPMALTIMACATQAGGLVARFGAGPVLGAGLTLMTAGLALFSRISVNGDYASDFLVPGLLASIGIGLSIVPSTIAATATAAPGEAGLASGLVNTSRQMGGALGLAILASLSVLFTRHLITVDYRAPILAVTDGFRLAFLIGAAFTAVAALVAVRYIPRNVRPLAPVASAAPAAAPASAARPEAPAAAAPPAALAAAAPPVAPAAAAPSGASTVGAAPTASPAQAAPSGAPAQAAPSAAEGRPAGAVGHPPHASVAFVRADGARWPLARGAMTLRPGSSPPGSHRGA